MAALAGGVAATRLQAALGLNWRRYVLAMSPQTRDEGTHLAKANGNSAPEVLRQVTERILCTLRDY